MNPVRVLSPLRGYRPRYADVAATLALLLAMGGTAYAATSLGPHTVGTPQLKKHAVTAVKIHGGAVTTRKLEPGAVTNAKLADGSVDGLTLADLAVTTSKLGLNAVTGPNVAANSLSLSDLVGADVSGTIALTMPAHSCGALIIAVSGAQVGQLVLFTFTGNTAVPSTVTFGGSRVTSAGTVRTLACNVGDSTVTVSNLGIRVATFG